MIFTADGVKLSQNLRGGRVPEQSDNRHLRMPSLKILMMVFEQAACSAQLVHSLGSTELRQQSPLL